MLHPTRHCSVRLAPIAEDSSLQPPVESDSVSVPMRRVMLSHPLPVFGLVSRYLTNYLIGRSPLPGAKLSSESTWSITADFSTLSSTLGFDRITRPFATLPRRASFDLHALAMPPAFNLSEDQTLQLIAYASGDKHRSISNLKLYKPTIRRQIGGLSTITR